MNNVTCFEVSMLTFLPKLMLLLYLISFWNSDFIGRPPFAEENLDRTSLNASAVLKLSQRFLLPCWITSRSRFHVLHGNTARIMFFFFWNAKTARESEELSVIPSNCRSNILFVHHFPFATLALLLFRRNNKAVILVLPCCLADYLLSVDWILGVANLKTWRHLFPFVSGNA